MRPGLLFQSARDNTWHVKEFQCVETHRRRIFIGIIGREYFVTVCVGGSRLEQPSVNYGRLKTSWVAWNAVFWVFARDILSLSIPPCKHGGFKALSR